MASSFIDQIPSIIHLVQRLKPSTILDVGKGFGKYGFLIHEYVGISTQKKINPSQSLKFQSSVAIDAVEVDTDLLLPHLDHLYNKVYFGDILDIYRDLPTYQLILMVDIIEHIDKGKALKMLKFYLEQGCRIIVATPINYFQQHLYDSKFEEHVSHWSAKDFEQVGFVSKQFFTAGAVYLLSEEPLDVRGFGDGLMKKLRRIGRAIRNELSI